MSDGLWWRKLKRGIIRDDHLEQVAYSLPQELRPQVISWYVVAYMLADDDGVFDFEDGGIFSLRCFSSVEDVTKIKEQMEKKGLIQNVIGGKNTVYLINDWIEVEDSMFKRRPAQTASQRREIVARRIKEEQKEKAQDKISVAKSRKQIAEMKKGIITEEEPAPEIIQEELQRVIDKIPDFPDLPEIPEEVLAQRVKNESFFSCRDNSTKKGEMSKHTQDRTGQNITEHDSTAQRQHSTETAQETTAQHKDSTAKDNNDSAVAEEMLLSASADSNICDNRTESSSQLVNNSHYDAILTSLLQYFEENVSKLNENQQISEHCKVKEAADRMFKMVDKKNSGAIISSVFLSVVEKSFEDKPVTLPSELLLDKVWDYCKNKTKVILSLNDEDDEKEPNNVEKRKDSG